MTKARHRLTALRHAGDISIGYSDINVQPNIGTTRTITWYPTEDMTLHDVRGNLGATYDEFGSSLLGTGSTSATFLADQDIHHRRAGSSSDAYFKIGSAYTHTRLPVHGSGYEIVDFTYDFNMPDGKQGLWMDGYLSTPAKRCTMYFKSTDWGLPEEGGVTADGCTSSDTIYNATLVLTVDSVTTHEPEAESDGGFQHDGNKGRPPTAPIEQCRGDVDVFVQRVARGSSAEGASNGYTAGSMSDMAWWSYKGGDTLSTYWGSSGGNSGETYTANPLDTSDLDSTSGVSFSQLWDVESGHQYHIDVTDLVSDAMANRRGDLRLMLHYPYDCSGATTGYIWPPGTNPAVEAIPSTFTNWINETTYHSKNSNPVDYRPRIDITYFRVSPI